MKTVVPSHFKNQIGHFSPGIIHGDTLYISGQLGISPYNGIMPGTVEAQALQALQNIDDVLKEAKLNKNSIILTRIYMPDITYIQDINMAYEEYFGEHKPARTIITTLSLYHDCMVEIEAIAALN